MSKEDEKINTYSPLVNEITKLHRGLAKVITLVGGCLGVVSCRLEQYLKDLDITDALGGMQTSAQLLGQLESCKRHMDFKPEVWGRAKL